jgi:S-adenosylmethionine:tRNA ribosyltransferase-isomerase
MKTSDFDYHLPQERIAQEPVEPRDSSRLMVLDRKNNTTCHKVFNQLSELLVPGDVLVFNNSRVIPARIRGKRASTGGNVEILLLKKVAPLTWEVLAKPARKLKTGEEVYLPQVEVTATIIGEKEEGIRLIRFSSEEKLFTAGEMPLPPYIHQPIEDRERYQTVYSKVLGSAAAPTSGLHFTQNLLADLKAKSVEIHFITLHISLDSFRPVNTENPPQHIIHTEYGQIDKQVAYAVKSAKKEGRRVIAVGTSSARLLEQAAGVEHFNGWADLFILTGYKFKVIDGLITNFHLPRSTLLMLVSAFAGRDFILKSYQEAMKMNYRFFSFGDAMLIV